jgi:hypothetical protein
MAVMKHTNDLRAYKTLSIYSREAQQVRSLLKHSFCMQHQVTWGTSLAAMDSMVA